MSDVTFEAMETATSTTEWMEKRRGRRPLGVNVPHCLQEVESKGAKLASSLAVVSRDVRSVGNDMKTWTIVKHKIV